MSTSGLMSVGLRAMMANSASLQVTGHNIANANVEGYSRQSAIQQTSEGQFTGAGYFGKGASVVDVRRAHDAFLTAQLQAAQSLSKMDETRAGQLEQLQQVFPSGSAGLGYAMGDFLNAVADVGNSPSDYSARQVVLARASDAAARFSTAAERIETLQAGVRADLNTSVDTVNGLAANIASLNQRIASVYALDQKPNDLMDQRDQLVKQLSEYVQVSTVPASDGSLGVFLAGGQRLVLGTEAAQLVVAPDSEDPSRAALLLDDHGVQMPLGDSLFSGGSITGLLRFQNTDLVDARNRLGQMARAFAMSINEAQSLGLDLGDPPTPGDPLFLVGDEQAIPNAHNARDASGNLMASVSIEVVDHTLVQASDYRLTLDPANAGKYLATRLSDGKSFHNLSSGDTVDGFTITVPSPGLQSGDSFLLQPVAHAATGMKRVLDDPSGIAAASPLSATMDTGNKGTASLAGLTMTGAKPTALASMDLVFGTEVTLAAGTVLEDGSVLSADTQALTYTWSSADSTGANIGSGSGYWVPGHPIGAATGANVALSLSGTPQKDDVLHVTETEFPATNNGNALQMNALRSEAFVGRSVRADGSVAEGATLTDAYANAMADIGVRVQTAQSASQISAASATQAAQIVASKSGVNLDEEAARLLQFQQSYQAAAKVLQVAQQVFDTMLQLGS